MYIVHVTPIAKNVGRDSLSYFTFKDIPIGSVVDVPLRKSIVPALVLRKEDASTIKTLLRTQQFSTRNIKNPRPRTLLSTAFVSAAQETSEHFATTIGAVLNSFLPTAILKDTAEPLSQQPDKTSPLGGEVLSGCCEDYEVLALQTSKSERAHSYKTLLRGALARGESAFLLAPTIREAENFKDLYKKGIEKYIFLLHSGLTPKQQKEAWAGALSQAHPVLIIATKGFISIPRKDFGIFVIESVGSEVYRGITRPFIDTRVLVQKLAKYLGAKLVLGDILLQASIHKSLAENTATEFEGATKKMRIGGRTLPIDMSEYTRKAKEEKNQYPILSPEVKSAVKNLKGHMFILASRRGIAPQTLCQDCGTIVLCALCSVPVSLHGGTARRTFLCHTCGEAKDAKSVCTTCGSWRLKPYGIGIERVKEVTESITKLPIYRIDADTTKTDKKVQEVLASFYQAKSAILIGTTKALPHLHTNIENSVLVSLDAMLAVPNFTAEEQAFRTILKLKELTKDTLFIQTRNPTNKTLWYASQGAVADFVESELALREKFKYPPYATFIKISIIGTRNYVIKEMKKLLHLLEDYKPRAFRGLIPMRRGKFALHALVRFTGKWPSEKLVTLIRALPPSFVIEID